MNLKFRGRKFVTAAGGILCALTLSIQAFAQLDPYDPSSPNYVGNKVTAKKNKSLIRFSTASLSTAAGRSFDEFGETAVFYSGTVGFRVGEKWSSDVTVDYSHPLDLDAERPDRWELEDVTLRAVRPNVWKSKDKSTYMSLQFALSLPTSGTSQDSGMRASASVRAPIAKRMGKATLIVTPTLVVANHRFDTADEFGFVKNSPYGAALSGALRYSITRKLAVLGAASIYTYWDYQSRNKNIQSLSASLQYSISNHWFGTFGYRWRDRIITNNSVFDDDTSRLSGSLTYTF